MIAKYLLDRGFKKSCTTLCKEAKLTDDVYINEHTDLCTIFSQFCSRLGDNSKLIKKAGTSITKQPGKELFSPGAVCSLSNNQLENSVEDVIDLKWSESQDTFQSCFDYTRLDPKFIKNREHLLDFSTSFVMALNKFIQRYPDYEEIAKVISRFVNDFHKKEKKI